MFLDLHGEICSKYIQEESGHLQLHPISESTSKPEKASCLDQLLLNCGKVYMQLAVYKRIN